MRIKPLLIALALTLSFMPGIAQANVKPVIESFTFTPNDVELIAANTNVSFELVVSHPSGIKNTSTVATLIGPYGTTLSTLLNRNDAPINSLLTKVIFKGTLTIPQGIPTGAYTISVAEVNSNPTGRVEYGTGVITPNKIRNLVGAENALLVRKSGDLSLSYETFVGPTHDTSLGISYDDSTKYNNDNPPIWKVGEVYVPSKYFELRVPTLTLSVKSSTPAICSTDGKELKLIATGNCIFTISTAKTENYVLKEIIQSITITAARNKPELVMSNISNQTSKNLPKIIEIFRVYSPTGVYVMPQSITPAVCIANGFYVQIVGGGTCTITYQSAANTSYLASDLYKVSFEVTRDPQTMTFTLPVNADISAKTQALAATASSGATVVYSTTSTDACSITGSNLNLLKAGNCVVTASQAGTSTLAPVSITATIMLTGAVIAPTPIATKKTIVCTKGKANKKVSGANPKCPKGFKVKK